MKINKKIIVMTQASVLFALVCFVFSGRSQKFDYATVRAQLAQAQSDLDAGRYADVIAVCEALLPRLDPVLNRADWYEAVWLHSRAQVSNGHAFKSVWFLAETLQKQHIDDSVTAKIAGLTGFACLYAGSFEQGLWFYEQNLTGLLRHHCKNGIGTAYMNLGYSLLGQGDYRAARQYFLTALPLLKVEGNAWNTSETLINLGDLSRYLMEFDSARAYYRRAVDVYPDNQYRLPSLLGWADADQGRYREALAHFRETCRAGNGGTEEARIMGYCADRLGDTLEANRQYRLALQSAEEADDSVRAYTYIGKSLLRRGQPQRALPVFQTALQCRFPDFQPSGWADNPNIGANSAFWPVELLRGKAQALLALGSKRSDYLHGALTAASLAVRALDSLRTGLRDETSGQDAVDYAYATYETGIQAALALDALEPGRGHDVTAYQLAESAKSVVLKNQLAEKELRRSLNLPDSLLWREKAALAAAAYWEAAGRADSLLAANRRLAKIRGDLAQQAPILQKIQTQVQNPGLQELQKALAPGELLLQYFWGDSMVVVFGLQQNALLTHSFRRDAAMEQSLEDFQAALADWRLPAATCAGRAAPLYERLCAPLLARAQGVQRLILVPDGPLWALPFEALTAAQEAPFLVEQYPLSYDWSGALWWQARTRGRTAWAFRSEYGGFAPQYPASAQYAATLGSTAPGDLPEARAAVGAAAASWGGRAWQGEGVDEDLFRREAGRYHLLHLAMHGQADRHDRTRTGLLFPDPKGGIQLLNSLEISQMDLRAELAVLSACNTNSGANYRGEGVMSLSRAFALAGCPAITANLWEVPSRETNDITADFLQLLRRGRSKDEALRAAKLTYLARAEPERRHPYFWAGQVLIGREDPLPGSHLGWWLGGVLAVLGLLGWVWYRKRRSFPALK